MLPQLIFLAWKICAWLRQKSAVRALITLPPGIVIKDAQTNSSSTDKIIFNDVLQVWTQVPWRFQVLNLVTSCKPNYNRAPKTEHWISARAEICIHIFGFWFQTFLISDFRALIIWLKPKPASTVEERSLRNISSEGTAVRISPRGFFLSVANYI